MTDVYALYLLDVNRAAYVSRRRNVFFTQLLLNTLAILSREGVSADTDKLKAVAEMPRPKTGRNFTDF